MKIESIEADLETPMNHDGVSRAVIIHGIGGSKKQKIIQFLARILVEMGYAVITFDCRNSSGMSGGDIQDATTGGYYEDLEIVLNFATSEMGFSYPVMLVGVSLGGGVATMYAENHQERVKSLCLISTVVSGDLVVEAMEGFFGKKIDRKNPPHFPISTPNGYVIFEWRNPEGLLDYNMLTNASAITMPTLFISGSGDTWTPAKYPRVLYDAITTEDKKFVIVKSSDHSLTEAVTLDEISRTLGEWIEGHR
ncbi:MAG: alpha/beta fold hydrolase [bacterium]|nr:alpha/beta fold hydrolase [bacterium]